MKTYYLVSLLLLLFSCDSSSGDDSETEDHAPKIIKAFDTFSVDFGSENQVFTLSDYISDEDGDEITFTASSSNPTSVGVSVTATSLTVSFLEEGSAVLIISARSTDKSITASFTVNVGAKTDISPVIANALADISINLNHADTVISVTDVFSDADGDSFTYSVTSSNTDLVTSTISGANLSISYTSGSFGESTISVTATATANGKTVTDNFLITVKNNSTSILTDAEVQFSDGNYTEAIAYFKQLLNHSDNKVKADAYAGLGYSLMRTESISNAYTRFTEGLENAESTNDLKSGLCFLEFSFKDNYTSAITLGNEILTTNSSFEMKYDSTVNHKDIRLTVAQSYFALNDYSNCLTHVQTLGKLTNSSPSDSDIETSLLNVLRDLSDELK